MASNSWKIFQTWSLVACGAALLIAAFRVPKRKREPLILAGSGLLLTGAYPERPDKNGIDKVGLASEQSFPASDAPPWNP